MPQVRRCKHQNCHKLVAQPAICCDKHKQYEAEYKAKREKYSRTYYNTRTRNRTEDKREQYNFYRSKTWNSLRNIVLNRDNYLCQYCLALGKLTPNSRIGDHVTPVEVAPELRTDPANVATACRTCDNIKRALEQEIYGTGQGNELKNRELRFSVKEWALKIQKKKDTRE